MSSAFQRHRRITIAAAGLVIAAASVTALGLTGTFSSAPQAAKTASASGQRIQFWTVAKIVKNAAAAPALPAYAYVAAAGGFEVVKVSVATDTIIGTLGDDTGEGVAVSPDGSTVYIADTGQYGVLAANSTTGAEKSVEVGGYPQDVALSPDGSLLYATVTGGDTGPGGSNQIAVINTATDTVTGDITVGTAPRQVVFSPDGTRAYVTTEDGVYAISGGGQATALNSALTAIAFGPAPAS
jgi:YVTN family beta-propeller protein